MMLVLRAAAMLAGLCAAAPFLVLAQTAPATAPARTVVVTATLEAFEVTDVYAKDSGYLVEVKKDLGDHVKQGEPLAIIDDPELATQIESARAAHLAKEAVAKAGEAAVEQAKKARDVVKSQRAGIETERQLAEVTFKRQEELFAGKAITNQQLDESRAKLEVARAQSDVAGAKVSAAEADIAAAEANLAVARAQVVVAQSEVQKLVTLQQYTKVTAPFEGVITRRMVNRGDLVQSGSTNRATPLFTVQRMDKIRVFCDVPEGNAAAVGQGTAAAVKVFGLNNQVISGTVTRVGMALNSGTRTMRAEIDLENPEEKLRPGMYAQVTLTLDSK